MVSLLLAVVLASGGAVGQSPSHDYTLAYHQSVADKQPLMVVVGADWCPACQTLKNSTIQTMKQSGELDQVHLAMVDRDADPELAAQLMEGEQLIPQIIVFAQDDAGQWQRRKLTGYQPAQPVRSLIRRVLTLGRRR